MDAFAHEWLHLLLRWLHILAGIMWVGDSFLFMWLDSHLAPPSEKRDGAVVGELWMVHSGGFYEVIKRKFLAPDELPPQLHWFKWESYTTWTSGFCLLIVVYYLGDNGFLVDPRIMTLGKGAAAAIGLAFLVGGWLVYDTLWRSPLGRNVYAGSAATFVLIGAASYGLTHVFGGRAAFIHLGAMLATIMAANVFFRIIPAQKHMLAATRAGTEVDTRLGARAKSRSTHNHYLTLPVLFTMLSNHFPSTYAQRLNWLVVLLLIAFGVGVKHLMRYRHKTSPLFALPTLAALVAVIVITLQPAAGGAQLAGFTNHQPVAFAEVQAIVARRCITCHAHQPSNPSFTQPPAGVMLDTPEGLAGHAERIGVRAVLTKTMPLGNLTGMTDEERVTLGAWLAQGAHTDGAAKGELAVPPAALAGTAVDKARAIFASRCVNCHGATGEGDGVAAAALNPKPRRFRNTAWQATVDDTHIAKVIVGGGPAVGKSPLMPPNPDLAGQPDVVAALVQIVRGFADNGAAAVAP